MKTIDLETVKAWALTEIEKEGRDFVYKEEERQDHDIAMCYYFEDGAPSCLVGRMFANNGLLTEEQVSGEDGEGNLLNEVTARSLVNFLGIEASEDVRKFLTTLQAEQDSGNTWGQAYDEAASRLVW